MTDRARARGGLSPAVTPRRRRARLSLGLALLALLVWSPSCQFLQNEFFQLDTARPAPHPELPLQAW